MASRHAFEIYWLPRSEWIISGKSVLRQSFALSIVSITVDTSIVSERVQAMIFLAYKSITQLTLKVGDFLRFIRSVTAGTDNGNITVIISELGFLASKSTDADTQVLCTFNLCKIRVLFAIVDSIQLELLGVMSFLS